jgi:hypothetical protein
MQVVTGDDDGYINLYYYPSTSVRIYIYIMNLYIHNESTYMNMYRLLLVMMMVM